jgi:hypothetical protein
MVQPEPPAGGTLTGANTLIVTAIPSTFGAGWQHVTVQVPADNSSVAYDVNEARVYTYDGDDTITVNGLNRGNVSGGEGKDTVDLNNCVGLAVSGLSPAEQGDGSPGSPVDDSDTFHLQDSRGIGLTMAEGDDTAYLRGDCQRTSIYGRLGMDHIIFEDFTDFTDGYISLDENGDIVDATNIFANHVEVYGGDGSDRINFFGSVGQVALYGMGGNDFLYGGKDDDYLEGGPGDDVMYGYEGNDLFDTRDGRAGNDTVFGGTNGSFGDALFWDGREGRVIGIEYYYL